MKIVVSAVLTSVIAFAGAGSSAQAQTASRVLPVQAIEWGAGPDSFPPGIKAALLYGDPTKEGPFVLRLKAPKGYHIAPHTHPKAEIVTVISGTVHLGMGATANRSKAQVLPAGSFFVMEPGMAHYAFMDDEAVVQLNGSGPWGLTYANPKDDPRQKAP